ncbi:MAG TPA: SURF1 family protein [Acidisphaera sp.]|nr:SURF1 family protein [Acidisphaera sp.]
MSAVMVAILIGLGVWQLHRLAWKQGLLAQIAAAESAPAVKLPTNPPPFAKVAVQGRWAEVSARYGAEVRHTPAGDKMGAFLLTPLLRDDGPPLLVDRGWLPDDAPTPPPGEASVEGYLHPAEHAGWLSPPDDPAKRRFYTLDPAGIGAALGVAGPAPYTLVVLGPPGGSPAPAQTLPRPPNDHLSYALTWFGLAGVLLVVFTLYARKVLRA